MEYPSGRFFAAIPTILLAGILAVDFENILYSLYLGVLVVFPAIFLGMLILFLVVAARTKDTRHPVTLAVILLLIGMILFPVFVFPVSSLIEHHTKWNRVSAFVRTSYEVGDSFDFTITAHGNGSKSRFSLERGYTNITINENYREGPSLYYRLRPDLQIRIGDKFKPLEAESLRRAFDENQLSQLLETGHIRSYYDMLEALSVVDSESAFEGGFSDVRSAEIEFVPHENTVYRIVFGIIASVALLLSITLSRRRPDEAVEGQ
ncbi:MAG: hypothetical protein AAF357_08115 [Verrucomicrobiota bacterium]